MLTTKDEIQALISDVQRHPLQCNYPHDFERSTLSKSEASVPVKTVNESPAIAQGGVLLTQNDA